MSWDFVWGLAIGSCLGCLFAGLAASGRDDQEHVELSDYDEKKNEE